MFTKLRKSQTGDTIVEVLIAIAIAAFAIGTSYAIANKSIQRAITARERNEATNNIQSQVSALKFRAKMSPSTFDSTFGVPSSFAGVGTARHFCLNTQSSGPSDTANPWTPYTNNVDDTSANNLSVGVPGNGYNPNCKATTTNGTDYYIDISAMVTAVSRTSKNPTVYRVTVRWSAVGTGATQKAEIFYRLSTNLGLISAPASIAFGFEATNLNAG